MTPEDLIKLEYSHIIQKDYVGIPAIQIKELADLFEFYHQIKLSEYISQRDYHEIKNKVIVSLN